MTTGLKEVYEYDLLNRYSGYSFVETTMADLVKVEFKDAGDTTVAAAVSLLLVDAYRSIRNDVLNAESPVFLLSMAQRDGLTSPLEGAIISDLTTYRTSVYIDGAWYERAMDAYGSMYENNGSGSTLSNADTYKGWTTATAGVFDAGSLVSYKNNGVADRLVIEAGGAGDYKVSFNASFTNEGGNLTTAAIHINGTEQGSIMAATYGDSSKQSALNASDILTLADDSYVDLRVKSTASDDLGLYQVNVNVERVS